RGRAYAVALLVAAVLLGQAVIPDQGAAQGRGPSGPVPPAPTRTPPLSVGNGSDLVKVLVTFRSRPGPSESAMLNAVGASVRRRYQLIPTTAITLPRAALTALSSHPNVLRVEPDVTIKAFQGGTPAELDASWGVKHIGAGDVQAGGNLGTCIK